MTARTIRKGDRFIFDRPGLAARPECVPCVLCRQRGTLTAYEITSVRSGLVYFLPVYDCCGQKHDRTVTGSKARPLCRDLDDIAAGVVRTSVGSPPAPIEWLDKETTP